MAKIGIYSDVHISHNSSIMPTYSNNDDFYTTRLRMCMNSIEWAHQQFEHNNVDMIINCGDTFNSHTVSSDELSAITHIIKQIFNKPEENIIPEFTLIGNHDKFNNMFNSLNWMSLVNNTKLINDYMYLEIDNIDIYCISYYDAPEFINKINEMLNNYPKKHSKSILFMHGDINGSWLAGSKRIENNIPTDFLTTYFDIVFNGHIHCHERIYNKNDKQIFNVGSLTSHSFADSNNHIPACWIYDTNKDKLKFIENPYAILFMTKCIEDKFDIQVLKEQVLSINNDIILKIKCSFDLKEIIEKTLEPLKNIIKTKYVFTYSNEMKNDFNNKVEQIDQSSQLDVKDKFITFLSGRNDLKGDIDLYINALK